MPCFFQSVHIIYLLTDRTKERASKDANSVNKTTSKFLVDTTMNEVNVLKAGCLLS